MFVPVNGRLLRVLDVGRGDRVFVAHGGWVGGAELWQQQVELLTQRGWRVVTFDHRGSGQSPAKAANVSVDGLVDDLEAILHQLDIERCVLGGVSMGTVAALRVARRVPERVEGLVLVGGSSRWPNWQVRPLVAGLTVFYRGTLAAFGALAIVEPDVRHRVRRWFRQISRQADPRAARAMMRSLSGTDLRAEVESLHRPALLIHGTRDLIVLPRFARELAESLPDSELKLLPGAGHLPTLTRPREIADAVHARFGAGP